MAAYDLQEQEQIANLKAFWKSWGTPIVVALLVGVTAVVGNKLWNAHKQKRAEAASDLYVGMEKAVKAGDAAKSKALALQLRGDYQNTPYAVRAAMMLAQTAINGKDLKTAQSQLQWALDNTAEDDLKDLLRLRLAAVLLDQKQYAEALKMLDNKPDDAYLALFADLKGDILFAQGKTAEAAKAYEIAINKADKQSPLHQLLQFKVDSLGGNK